MKSINNDNCISRICYIQKNGSRLHRTIASELIKIFKAKETHKVNLVRKFSSYFNISYSSVSRFTKKLGYPSFKHFSFDYAQLTKKPIAKVMRESQLANKLAKIVQQKRDTINSISGKVFVLTSRRAKGIGKLFKERLDEIHIENNLFVEKKDDLETFVNNIVNGTLILISISGFSNLVAKSINYINKMNKKPYVIILTAAKEMKIFENYQFISINQLNDNVFQHNSYPEYNHCIIEITKLIINIVNSLYLKRVKNK